MYKNEFYYRSFYSIKEFGLPCMLITTIGYSDEAYSTIANKFQIIKNISLTLNSLPAKFNFYFKLKFSYICCILKRSEIISLCDIAAYFGGIKFASWGLPHIHFLIWIEDIKNQNHQLLNQGIAQITLKMTIMIKINLF